jgi:type VI secretion system protein ImpE
LSLQPVKQMLDAALKEVRGAPADASARMKLFRLFALTGQWERAVTQLDTASNLDTSLGMTSMVYKQSLACELFRSEVFQGKRTPVIAGEPEQWLAWLVEALRADATGGGNSLREQAVEAATARPGSIDGQPFEWIADADPRLGPVCEAFIDGKYFWIPFERISEIRLAPPDDLIDLVWASCDLTFSSGGTKPALIPVRYPGTESTDDDELVQARKTIWQGDEESGFRGLGQRSLVTDATEAGLLDIRSIVIG